MHKMNALQLKAHDYLLKPIQEEKLLKVLAEVIHEKKQEEKRRPEEVYGAQETLVQDILKILYAQVANADFSLQELSKSLHVSSSYLSRYLKKETGLTFSELLTKLRMEVAVTLLESHPKMTILEVSERSGFKNQHYFSKVFRTVIGQTPSDYKKQFL
ncbi:MAG TPA: hypothetical protein DEA52_04500 [Clostridiaceae bacterium]|nr:hypothetical protein [Clostridiaceae bacterium]